MTESSLHCTILVLFCVLFVQWRMFASVNFYSQARSILLFKKMKKMREKYYNGDYSEGERVIVLGKITNSGGNIFLLIVTVEFTFTFANFFEKKAPGQSIKSEKDFRLSLPRFIFL